MHFPIDTADDFGLASGGYRRRPIPKHCETCPECLGPMEPDGTGSLYCNVARTEVPVDRYRCADCGLVTYD